MARLSNIALIIVVNVLICVLAKEEFYPERYDHLNVRRFLENNTLRESYYNCFMEITPCTSEQKALINVFSEAYQTKCRKCTKKQIENMNIVTDWFIIHEPLKWLLLIQKLINDLRKKYANDQ